MAELTHKPMTAPLCSFSDRYLIISCVSSEGVKVHCLYVNELHPHRNAVLSVERVETLSRYVNVTKVKHFCGIRTVLSQFSELTLRKSSSAAFNLHTEQ